MRRVRLGPAVAPGVLKRPARGRGAEAVESAQTKWARGEIVLVRDMEPGDLFKEKDVVVEEATYFQAPCKAAGTLTGLIFEDEKAYLKLRLTGTTNAALLQHHTGKPEQIYRVHVCPNGCNQEEVADDLIHGTRIRKSKGGDVDEGWTRNVEKALPMEPEDELAALRARVAEGPQGKKADEKSDDEKKAKKKESRKKKKAKKKEDKEKKEKSKKEKKKKVEETESSSSLEIKVDGSQPQAAAVKTNSALYKGTGMDARERARNRVARKARRYLNKKADTCSTSSSSQEGSSDLSEQLGGTEESIFEQSSKVRTLAERFPGALAGQAINCMRSALIAEVGLQQQPNKLYPCGVAYVRQHLSRKAQGPVLRAAWTC